MSTSCQFLFQYVLRRLSPRWNQGRLSLAHLGCDVIPCRGCTGVEFYANDPVNHFIHAPSSRSRKSTAFLAVFRSRPGLSKTGLHRDRDVIHTWNVASDITKVESISLSDSKCRQKIKDSSSYRAHTEFGRHVARFIHAAPKVNIEIYFTVFYDLL